MAYLNMAAANQALKIFYLPGLQYQLNTANPILTLMDKDSTSVVGSEIHMALRYGRQGGIGNRADDGLLPTPNSRQTKQAIWQTKNIFARIQVTDKTMRASRGQQGAFVSLLEADLEDAQNDAKDSVARQVFGDGTGATATFAVNTAVTTLNVTAGAATLYSGQFIDIYDSTVTTPKYTALQIADVDYVNNIVTLVAGTANVTTAAGDVAVIAGSANLELTGFKAVIGTTGNTLYGINRAQNTWFNPVNKAVNGEISEVGIQAEIDLVDQLAGGKTSVLVSSYGVRRAYQNLILATKQTIDVMNLEGGYSALKYNNMPFTVDKYCPSGTLYGLDMSTWKMYQIMDWDWLDDDGAVLNRVPNYAVWEATLARYCDMGCSKPRGNFVMTGITEH